MAPSLPIENLTIVVVSDFELAGTKTWTDELKMARALARQTTNVNFDVLIVEHESNRKTLPPQALFDALPTIKILYGPSESSAKLKDLAVSQCNSEWIAVLEADALPEDDWLEKLCASSQQDRHYIAYSGRTYYGAENTWRRVLNVLDRSFDDHGCAGPSNHISNNGALYRASVLRKFPYPDAVSAFISARTRNHAMRQAGHQFYSNPHALMRHAIGGFEFVNDFRRNTGYADMMSHPCRSPMRIPGLLARRMKSEIGGLSRVGGRYLKWFDLPWFVIMCAYVRIPEIFGMMDALNNVEQLEGSSYR